MGDRFKPESMIGMGQNMQSLCPPKAPTVGTLQTLPACEPDEFADTAGKKAGFSLHAVIAVRRQLTCPVRRQLSWPVECM